MSRGLKAMTESVRPPDGEAHSGSPPTHVLVVDDSSEARQAVRRALEREGFQVTEAKDGYEALDGIAAASPHVVLLDLGMPGMGGMEVLTRLRKTNSVPVIVLSGQAQESERVVALELGADDYIVKPFLVRELPARIRSLLRRSRGYSSPRLSFGPLEIRLEEREVLRHGAPVETTPREFDLLAKLASSPRRAFSRAELLEEVWDPPGTGRTRPR